MDPVQDLPEPESLGEYRLITLLGQGGMARVHVAVRHGEQGLAKLLVMKVLRAELARDPEARALFLDEARVSLRLNHPNVVHTYEVGEDQGRPFLVMEFLDGQPLSSVLHRIGPHNMPLPLRLRIVADVLEGLHHAHELKDFDGTSFDVVHRDLSPHNVFITYDGQVKVVDFGIAKAARSSSRTEEGIFKGKVSYAAPEQLELQTLDRRADIFAVGIVLWELLAGRRFGKGNEVEVFRARVHGDEPRVKALDLELPEGLADIVDRALAVDRDQRFQTAAEMAEALERVLTGLSSNASSRRELAKLLQDHFAADRRSVRERIDAVAFEGHTTGRRALHAGAGNTADAVVAERPEKPRPTLARRWGVALVGLVVLGAVGLVIAIFAAPPALAPSVDAEANAVTLTVFATPSAAAITLDGTLLPGNPYTGNVARDGRSRVIRVSAPGFEAQERRVKLEDNVALRVDLVASGAPGGGSATPLTANSGAPPSVDSGSPPAGEAAKIPAPRPDAGAPRGGRAGRKDVPAPGVPAANADPLEDRQ
jgi:serine/threonine-protein kinase